MLSQEKQIEILMQDHCTKTEAINHIKKGVQILTVDEFIQEMKYWELNEEEEKVYHNMLTNKKPLADWGIVTDDEGIIYIIGYCL